MSKRVKMRYISIYLAIGCSFVYSYILHKRLNYLEHAFLLQKFTYSTDKICNQIENIRIN